MSNNGTGKPDTRPELTQSDMIIIAALIVLIEKIFKKPSKG